MLTEIQIANRKKGVGASEAAIVLGLNADISPYQLWMIKTGKMTAEDISDLPQVHWGNVHEEAIAQHYAETTGCNVRRMNNTIFHKKYPFMLCHLDRKVEGSPKHLECKFSMYARDDWGQSGSDIVPMSYIVQVQYQLAVTGYQEADLAVLISGWDFRVYHFKRDEEIIAKLEEEVSAFWKCVETDTPPALRDRVDAALAYPFNKGDLKEAEPDVISTIEKFRIVRAQAKELELERERLSDSLTLFIKDAEGIRTDKEVLATWKANARGSRVLKVTEARV